MSALRLPFQSRQAADRLSLHRPYRSLLFFILRCWWCGGRWRGGRRHGGCAEVNALRADVVAAEATASRQAAERHRRAQERHRQHAQFLARRHQEQAAADTDRGYRRPPAPFGHQYEDPDTLRLATIGARR